MSRGTYFEVLDRIKPTMPEKARKADSEEVGSPSPALIIENSDRGVTTVTTKVESASLSSGDLFTQVSGRYVGGDQANRNGAFWSTEGLEFGLPSVAGGPINWLHEGQKIMGSIVSARLEGRPGLDSHIRVAGNLWNWVYPEEVEKVREYAAQGATYFSMECMANTVECAGPNGCGKRMPFADAQCRDGAACDHVKERSSYRKYIDPIFMGAAVIVPPVQPGWANAHMDVVREAASLTREDFADEVLVAQVLEWVKTGSASASVR